jgi:amidohydrolase
MSQERTARRGLDVLADRWRAQLTVELPDAVRLRHAIHAAPDLSGAENPTALRVVRALTHGLQDDQAVADETVAGTGRLLRLGPDGVAVGLRAELDALPMAERTGAPFASANGAMHACGHDVHLAALVAVMRAARTLDLPMGLVGLLQPREEVGPTGATDVIAAGVLADHDVQALVAAHVQPQVTAGHVTSDAGPVNAAVDEIEIVIEGAGGHSAYPHLTHDPVPALCRTVLALQDAARTAVDPLQPLVVSITRLEGSGAPNVIPDVARAAGTIRTMRAVDARRLHERIARTVAGIAAAHGCRGRYEVRRGEPALVNDPALAAGAAEWLARFDLPREGFASCGSDDFATYAGTLPILMMFVGTRDGGVSRDGERSEDGPAPMLHDARYLPPDDAVADVAQALIAGWLAGAQLVLDRGGQA